MMLIRLDPEKDATAVMSIPRDLKATIPGHGVDKINAAYSLGGPKLAVTTVRSLLDIPINHVVNVNFGGFSRRGRSASAASTSTSTAATSTTTTRRRAAAASATR